MHTYTQGEFFSPSLVENILLSNEFINQIYVCADSMMVCLSVYCVCGVCERECVRESVCECGCGCMRMCVLCVVRESMSECVCVCGCVYVCACVFV